METDELNEAKDFQDDFTESGKFSMWHVLIIALLMVPQLTYTLLRLATLHKGPSFKVRCEIPDLENSAWSFDEILNISQPVINNPNCTYYNYDYSTFTYKSYEEVIKLTSHNLKPNILNCFNVIYSYDTGYNTIYKEYRLICKKWLENIMFLSPNIGKLIGFLVLSPWADIFGRKLMIDFALNTFVVLMLIMNLTSTVELFILASFVGGFAFAPLKVSIEALSVELVLPSCRPLAFSIIQIGSSAIAFTLMPYLATLCKNWRYLQWIGCGGLLVFPMARWYIPESPRWLYSKEQNGKAWTILKNLKSPETQNHALLLFKNELKNTLGWHHLEFKSFCDRKFWFCLVLTCFTGSVYMKNFAEMLSDIYLTDKSNLYLYIRGITEFGSLALCLVLIYAVGRRITISITLTATVTALFALILLGHLTTTVDRVILYFILDLLTSASFNVSQLHLIENTPTSHRCTVIGFSDAISSFITIAIFFILQIKLSAFYLCIGILTLIAIPVTWLTYKDNKGNIFDTYADFAM